jgi:conjugative transfer signal peptidase TraF
MTGLLVLHALRFAINTTPSMPIGIYHMTPLSGPVTRGQIVEFCPTPQIAAIALARGFIGRGSCASGSRPFLKIVVAVGGDTVDVRSDAIFVDGKRVPHSATIQKDGRARPLAAVPRKVFHLQPGEIWLWTPFPHSWDSRYFGPVPAKNVDATATLLLALQSWDYTK